MWFEDDAFWRDFFAVLFPAETFEAAAGHLDRALALTDVRAGNALDLACGPGRYAVPLAQNGFRVTAVDRSALLLHEARMRAAAAGVEIEFVEHDMRSFVRAMFVRRGVWATRLATSMTATTTVVCCRPSTTTWHQAAGSSST